MIKARFEFKIEDVWVGVFWRWSKPYTDEAETALRTADRAGPFNCRTLDVWLCLLPCFPMHITIGPDAVPMKPQWHCPCGNSNIPAYKLVCDRCGRPTV